MLRDALAELDKVVSRRVFFDRIFKAGALVAALDVIGPEAFGALTAADKATALAVYSACCKLVIPVDQDPGWATFEPGISEYGLNVFVGRVALGGSPQAFDGFLGALVAFNQAPRTLGYSDLFLKLGPDAQIQYFTTALTGGFEADGYGDVLVVAAFFCMFTAKATFFSNYPRHLAQDSEFQVLQPSSVKTGWDIMGWKGPVGPEEEKALRAKYYDAPVIPGIDFSNPWI